MELTDIRLHTIKYYVDSFSVSAGSKSFDVPRVMISSIQIKMDYMNYIYPFVYVAVNLPGWMYMEVAKNSQSIQVAMNLKACLFQTSVAEEKNPTMITEYSGRYKAMCAIDTPVTDEVIQTKLEQQDDAYDKNYRFNEYYMAEFILYNSGTSGRVGRKGKSSEDLYFQDLDKLFKVKHRNHQPLYNGEYMTVHVMCMQNYNDALSKFSGYYQNGKEKYHLIAIPPNSLLTREDSMDPRVPKSRSLEFMTNDAILEALTCNKNYIVQIDAPGSSPYNGTYRIDKVDLTLLNEGDYMGPSFHIKLGK